MLAMETARVDTMRYLEQLCMAHNRRDRWGGLSLPVQKQVIYVGNYGVLGSSS